MMKFMPWKNSWFQLSLITTVLSAGLLLFDLGGPSHVIKIPKLPITTPSWLKPAPTAAQLAEATQDYNNGVTAYNSQNYATAVDDLTQAINLNPKYTDALIERGLAYDNQQAYDSAIQDDNQLMSIDPNNKIAYNNRGYVYYEQQNYSAALADYSKAIDLDPNYELAYVNRANANFYGGDEGQALQDYTRAFQLNPNNSYCYMMAAWILATSPRADLRDGRKAVEYANKAGDIDGWKDTSMTSTLAAACAENGDYQNAVKWISTFLKSSGIDARSLKDAQAQLAAYQSGQPWHRPPK